MSFHYQTGDDIRIGDRIAYGDASGVVEFIVTDGTPSTGEAWDHKDGVMLITDKFGRVFLSDPLNDEDLKLVSRS